MKIGEYWGIAFLVSSIGLLSCKESPDADSRSLPSDPPDTAPHAERVNSENHNDSTQKTKSQQTAQTVLDGPIGTGEGANMFFAWVEQDFGDVELPFYSALERLKEHGATDTELKCLAVPAIRKTPDIPEQQKIVEDFLPGPESKAAVYVEIALNAPLQKLDQVEKIADEMGPGIARSKIINSVTYRRVGSDPLPDVVNWIVDLPYPEDRDAAWEAVLIAAVRKSSLSQNELELLLQQSDYSRLTTEVAKQLRRQDEQ